MQRAILFDDAQPLAPLTDYRASFDIRTGARTTLERLRFALDLQIVGLAVPDALCDLTRERHAHAEFPIYCSSRLPNFEPGDVLINGRCVLPILEINNLELGQSLVESASGQVIATRPASLEAANAFMASWSPPVGSITPHDRAALLHRPWHIRTFLDDALNLDLVDMAANANEPELRGVLAFGEAPLHIHETAKIYPGVTFDVENGAVVIDEHAVLRPGSIIIGPSYIGPHSTVLDRTLVKAHSAIGPWCKVAGEVGGVIFQGFANKAHDGHLGDSYVGEWANLGAGTTNSNLLNTYGEVTMRATPTSSIERTGRQFMGCIIGDHVKTAICTRIMTGTILGTGTMYAASAPATGTIPRFAWITDDHQAGKKSFRPDKYLDIARTVMARRKRTLSDAYARQTAMLFAASTATT